MTQIDLSELTHNQQISGNFLILHQKELTQKRNGEPYLKMVLGDGSKKIKAVMWDNFEQFSDEVQTGSIVKIQGIATSYQNELQVTIHRIRPALEDEPTLDDFLPRSSSSPDELMNYILEIIDTIPVQFYKDLLLSFFSNATIKHEIVRVPAAKQLHHSTLGGLLEHTVTVTKICDLLCQLYPFLNRATLLTAALLHDIGKIYELNSSTFDYTDRGRLLGHLILGSDMIKEHCSRMEERDEQLELELLHAVLAHHGSHEWGSPIVPMTLEAITLHYADNLDAKITSFKHWISDNQDPERGHWSKYWPLMQRFLYGQNQSTEMSDESTQK